jgi:hypothetical protein
MTDCVYCGCDVTAHDPVFVSEGTDADPADADAYCNYGCLAAHVEEAGLATGTTCRVDL